MICSALTKNLVFSYWPGDFKLFFALDVTRAFYSSAALDETAGRAENRETRSTRLGMIFAQSDPAIRTSLAGRS